MTDIENAKIALLGHSIALCLGDKIITSDKRGISPMLFFIEEGFDLKGYSVADLVVGKAAAMLFVYAGIKEVFAKTISKSGADILKRHNISYSYNVLAENIINRNGDDICPMEKTVLHIDNIDIAYDLLKNKFAELKSKN